MFRRGGGYLVDNVLIFIFVRPELIVSSIVRDYGQTDAALADLSSIVLIAVYVVGCHARWGRTIGKSVVGLRVATVDGFSPPPFRAAVIRYVPLFLIGLSLYVIDWFVLPHWRIGMLKVEGRDVSIWRFVPLLWFLAEVVVAVRTKGYRSVHDLWAATVVTDESAKKQSG